MYIVLHTPPKKIFHGKKRLCKKSIRRDWRILNWAITVKVGDYIGTCTGTNAQVAKIEYHWANEGARRYKPNRSWYLDEIGFHDTKGGFHFCPGGGCAFPPESPEQILKYYQENWPLASPPKLDAHGVLTFDEAEREAWRAEFTKHYGC